MPGVAQHPGQGLPRERQAAGDRDLGTVKYDVIWQRQPGADQAQRHGGIEDHELGANVPSQRVDAADHDRVGQQDGLGGALDAERLLAVELCGAGVGAREHGERIGR